MLKKYIFSKLLILVSRLENKLWKLVYIKPRKYCMCDFTKKIKNQSPNPGMFDETKTR